MKLLIINPGATSTKIAVYQDTTETFKTNIEHKAEDLAPFPHIIDQLEYRRALIMDTLEANGYELTDFAAICGRAELDMLFIDPMRKSQGIGKLVWRRIEKKYPYQEWQVETPDYSNRNIHFYCETCGFHLIGKKTYDDGAGSVIMEKSVFVEKALT